MRVGRTKSRGHVVCCFLFILLWLVSSVHASRLRIEDTFDIVEEGETTQLTMTTTAPDNTSLLLCGEVAKEVVTPVRSHLACSILIRSKYHRAQGGLSDFHVSLGSASNGSLNGFLLADNGTKIVFYFVAPPKSGVDFIYAESIFTKTNISGSPLLVRVYETHDSSSPPLGGEVALIVIMSIFGLLLLSGMCLYTAGKILESRERRSYKNSKFVSIVSDD